MKKFWFIHFASFISTSPFSPFFPISAHFWIYLIWKKSDSISFIFLFLICLYFSIHSISPYFWIFHIFEVILFDKNSNWSLFSQLSILPYSLHFSYFSIFFNLSYLKNKFWFCSIHFFFPHLPISPRSSIHSLSPISP